MNVAAPGARRRFFVAILGAGGMQEAKNTARALVRIGYDGSVHKLFRARDAESRFDNELLSLIHI